MKYLLIFLIIISFANPAFAARMVPGQVPVLKPLQPIPEGVGPNYKESINTPPKDKASQIQENAPGQNKSQGEMEGASLNLQAKSQTGKNSALVFTLLIIIIFGGGAAYLYARNRRSVKK